MSNVPEAVSTGAPYFYKQDYLADLTKKCASKDFEQVSKLLGNLGPSDKSTNWFLEKKNLERVNDSEGREIRDLIDTKVSTLDFSLIFEYLDRRPARIRENKGVYSPLEAEDGTVTKWRPLRLREANCRAGDRSKLRARPKSPD